MRKLFIIIVILLIGLIFRLFLTSNNNFIFNIDNARDMVDVREMVTLVKPRLISHTSGLEGVFMGPAWYYLLSGPYLISSGDPYASIILMILLWVVGGFFLLWVVSSYGWLVVIAVGSIWVSSNFVMLTVLYAFNPNPVVLLMPLFGYLLLLYLQKNRLFLSILVWFLSGLFFNFEIILGIFMPLLIIIIVLISGNKKYFKQRNFWIGSLFFVLMLLPQVIFDFKHQFLMTQSMINFYNQSYHGFDLISRFNIVFRTFREVLGGTFMNSQILINIFLLLVGLLIISLKSNNLQKNNLLKVVLVSLILLFTGFMILPFDIGTWHIGGISSVYILLFGLGIYNLATKFKLLGSILAAILVCFVVYTSILNLVDQLSFRDSKDVSVLRNEIAAIDYVYQEARGRNFKVYVYLPSVIDYPYQYLFWWHGQRKYGYLPLDYAYLPEKPEYISQKNKFSNGNIPDFGGLVFLIKEPDRINQRHLWENSFKSLKVINQTNVNGLEIETRSERID